MLEYVDERCQLKKGHTYFNNINLYLEMLEIETAYFIVYVKDRVIVNTINFDGQFFKFQIDNLKQYYVDHYLLSVLGKPI